MRECVWALYFSPTGGTKKAALYLAESLGKEVKEADLAAPDFKGAAFKEGELVVAGAPPPRGARRLQPLPPSAAGFRD